MQSSTLACSCTVGWQSSACDNRNNRRNLRRYVSLWGSSGGVGASGTGSGSREEEPTRLQEEEEEKVLATLSGVIEPCTGKGVVELGLVQDVLINGETLF